MQNCELCAKDGDEVAANRELDGIWMCVDCIVAMNVANDREKLAKRETTTIIRPSKTCGIVRSR